MQTTHAVLVETRDGLVRSMGEREAQISAYCTSEATGPQPLRKSGKRPSGMVRQRSDEDLNESRRISRTSSSEAQRGSRSGQSMRRSWVNWDGSAVSASGGSSEDGGSPMREPTSGEAMIRARFPCAPPVVEEDYDSGATSMEGSGKNLLSEDSSSGAPGSRHSGTAMGPICSGRIPGVHDSSETPMHVDDDLDPQAVVQIQKLMQDVSKALADHSEWDASTTAERVRKIDRICSEIVKTEADSRANSRANSNRGSMADMSNSLRNSLSDPSKPVAGHAAHPQSPLMNHPSGGLAHPPSPLLPSAHIPTAGPPTAPGTLVPPRPFLSKLRRANASAKGVPPTLVIPAVHASGRQSAESIGSHSEALSESSLDLSPVDQHVASEGKRSQRGSWTRLPADAFAAASRLSFNSKSKAGTPRSDGGSDRASEGHGQQRNGSSHAVPSRGGLAVKLGMSALVSISGSFRSSSEAGPIMLDHSPDISPGIEPHPHYDASPEYAGAVHRQYPTETSIIKSVVAAADS